jgi:threonylcarbamoyladenosine tRNA methylthiotransferase MtaB
MPQVAPDVRRARAAALRAHAAERRARWLAGLQGATAEVLVELDGRSGHSPAFAPVRLIHDATPRSIARARLIGLEDGILMAEAA